MAVAGSVGHQLEHLLVGFALDWHAVNTEELVPRSQAPVLLGRTERHDGADVDLWRTREEQLEAPIRAGGTTWESLEILLSRFERLSSCVLSCGGLLSLL